MSTRAAELDTPRRWLWIATLLAVTTCTLGLVSAALLHRHGTDTPARVSDNVFFHLYVRLEPVELALIAVTALVAMLFLRSARARSVSADGSSAGHARLRTTAVLVAAAAFGVVAWAGSHIVLHSLPLAMDEYNAVFQSEIFARGHASAALPVAWRGLARALTPVFVSYYDSSGTWRAGYLPVYAAIRAPFALVGADDVVNPLIGALTLLTLHAVTRRLWKDDQRRQWLALVFLGTSSQFLFMSMSWYSMPAHLLLNLLWLLLYMRGDRLGLALAPVIGVLALGLHNPFPHALFVAPFLVRALTQRRFKWLGYAAAVYALGSLAWLAWLRTSYAYQHAAGGMLGAFALPGMWQLKFQLLQLSMVFTWQAPVVTTFFIVGVLAWRRLDGIERDLAAGFLLTAAFHFLFPLTQGHGWGYRYIYSALGNLVIIAAAGAAFTSESVSWNGVRIVALGSAAVALLVQWPLRMIGVERFVRPFAAAVAHTRAIPTAMVVVYGDSSYYGRDLVRNDPFLRTTPKLMSGEALGPEGVSALQHQYGSAVHVVGRAEIAATGVPTF